MKPIYLDYAAGSPVDRRVVQAMLPFFTISYANPNSLHAAGRGARRAIEEARTRIAGVLHGLPEEIFFTSSGTESNNLALKSLAFQARKGHLVTSAIEHPSVLETCTWLQGRGFLVTYLPVDRRGLVSAKSVEKAIRKDTLLISIHYANSEIGTIQPIAEIGRIARRHNVPFHTDACQASMLELNLQKLQVDLLSLNAAKMYGPKGIGLLYQRQNVLLEPLLQGGEHSLGSSGTENVPGIVGMAKALELVQQQRAKENQRLRSLTHYFLKRVLTEIPQVRFNGHPRQRVPGIVNLSFQGVEAETVLHHLSQKKIYVSTGSACTSGEVKVSHVLKAIGLSDEEARGSVRFSWGAGVTTKELEQVVRVLKLIIEVLRRT